MKPAFRCCLAFLTGTVLSASLVAAQPTGSAWLRGRPDATIDLTSVEGIAAVHGQWRYMPARIVSIEAPSLGPDLRPSGPPSPTHDLEPKAGAADHDDSAWQVTGPPGPASRFGPGRLSMVWFRINVTIPAEVAGMSTAGTSVVLETVVDDYAEVWVDGQLADEVFGQTGGSLIGGWNAPNRVVIARDARPGQQIQLAILAANGPLSAPPFNFIWFRSATLDFWKPESMAADATPAVVDRLDPRIDELVPRDASIERLASGFAFTEGPVWVPASSAAGGHLLFSDPNENTIYRLNADRELFGFRPKSGYTGQDIGRYRQPGSNGLALDPEGRLTVCEHGNRRITRTEKNGLITVLADRHEGRRLNSPNDLVWHPDGALYFTDPPFGLPGFRDDPARELDFCGVWRLKDGQLSVISRDLSGPNGLAFSPNGKHLYVGNWDDHHKTVTRFELDGDGRVLDSRTFFDMTSAAGDDAIDGIKVDVQGNLYVSGPGGLWVIDPDGVHLGTIRPPEHPHNLCFGGEDGQTLFLTCQTGVYRMRLAVPGATHRATVMTPDRSSGPGSGAPNSGSVTR
jgi:gluconolactonase